MKFATVPVEEATGAILAHSLPIGQGRRLTKGLKLSDEHVARLQAAGIRKVTVARLDRGDVEENEAARRIAVALAGAGLELGACGRGRADLLAGQDGLLRIARTRLLDLARCDERIAIATRPADAAVHAGMRVATVKIIPFAVPEQAVRVIEEAIAQEGRPILSLAPFRPLRASLVETFPPHASPPQAPGDKLREVMTSRLARIGTRLDHLAVCRHDEAELAEVIASLAKRPESAELLLIAGASAIVDRRDVVPAALERAGGRVTRLGMPVEPGNLLMLGHCGAMTVIGLPGCARSPARSGLDLVLERIAAGLPLDDSTFAGFSIGGLIAPAPASLTRPRRSHPSGRIAALLLAAGSSRRFGPSDKLHAPLAGEPLIRHAARPLAEAGLAWRFVVHRPDDRRAPEILSDVSFRPVANPAHAEGMASSIRAGIDALLRAEDEAGTRFEGVFVMLADMPHVQSATVRRLLAAHKEALARESGDRTPLAFVPTYQGKRGHPVLFARAAFGELCALEGDEGARRLLGRWAPRVSEIAVDDPGILVDIDEEAALERLADRQS
ncbi:MAG: 4-diphosphocytidyl-2C-methyl-D-erythritol kinase [Alphaproteobacteria bacterium]|nr:MAG: 4-diphosphocytidyl-2C-methyl-D-erythritol kinase [Alphaproteobacteria bacterium]